MSALDDKYAAVIGINEYGRGIAPLRSAVNDARKIATVLEESHGYPTVHRLLDGAASRQAILHLLTETLVEEVQANSAVVLYFAGHGMARGEGTGGPQGYLLPQDANPADETTWLSMEVVRQALAKLPCRHMLVVLDCCFAGSFRWAAGRNFVPLFQPLFDSQYDRFLKGTAWQVLTSASCDQEAMDVAPGLYNYRDEDGASYHSPFAAALLRALGGEADSSRGRYEADGVLTATELHQYIFEELVPPGEKSRQTPGLWPLKPENRGEFIFLSPRHAKKTRPDPPLDEVHNPWLGLRAYDAGDAPLFFGRGRVVDALRKRLFDESSFKLLAVIGASGSGKSSVVKAGLLPQLERSREEAEVRWAVVRSSRLQGDPRRQLVEAEGRLAKVQEGHRKLLFIDQFEELYTQCPDRSARSAFLKGLRLLMSGEDPVRVILTLRSDFEPQLASSEHFGELLSAGRYVVPRLNSEEFREIIEEPAKVTALYFEPEGLVGELVDEVMALPGALPLLSFVLAEMYRQAQLRRRQQGDLDRALKRQDLAAAGGVVGALHRRASELFEGTDEKSRETIRRLFLRMVSRQGGRLARRRVERRELQYADPAEQGRVQAVLEEYVAARLLVADAGYVEPAHDTLVLAWEKLLHWLGQYGSQELERQVWRAASAWEARRASGSKEAHGLLWNQDPRLPQAETLRGDLNGLECEFVDTSVRRKRRRRNRGWALAATVMTALALLSALSLQQARVAKTRLDRAVETARQVTFVLAKELRSIAGAAKVREKLQRATHELLSDLGADNDPIVRYQLAATRDEVGELAMRKGDLAKAETEFRQAVAILEGALGDLPADSPWKTECRYNLSVFYRHLGQVFSRKGDLGTARQWYERALEVVQPLAVEQGEIAELHRQLAVLFTDLGEIAQTEGDVEVAQELYGRSLEIYRHQAEEEGGNAWRSDIAQSYGQLADLALAQGRVEEAKAWHLQALEISRSLVAAEPENAAWQSQLAIVYSNLAMVDGPWGAGVQAQNWMAESLRIREELSHAEPKNVKWKLRLSLAYSIRGQQLMAQQDPAAAGVWYEKALATAKELVALEPEYRDFQRTLAASYLSLGMLAQAQNDWPLANDRYQSALEIFVPLARAPEDLQAQGELAAAHSRVALVAIMRSDGERARHHLRQAIETYSTLATAQPANDQLQQDLLNSYHQLGSLAAGEGVVEMAQELYTQALEIAQRLAEKGPGLEGQNYVNLLGSYQLLGNLLQHSDPTQAQRYVELYQELEGRIKGDPALAQLSYLELYFGLGG